MEWYPERQDPQHQEPFWPSSTESRGPGWGLLLTIGIIAALAAGGLVWWLTGGWNDNSETSAAPGGPEELTNDTGPGEGPAASDGEPSTEGADETATATTAPTTAATTSTATTTIQATTTTITTVPPESPDQFGPSTLSTTSTVSTVGLDAVHFGMTVAAAQRAAGTVLVPAGPTGACYHAVPHDAPEGIVFLVHQGTIERVDINSGPITTRSGVGVGSPASMVTDLFGDMIERQARIDGTVDLIFVPKDPGDQNYRVVFNISEGAVRALKAGRLPQVMLDIGCESP